MEVAEKNGKEKEEDGNRIQIKRLGMMRKKFKVMELITTNLQFN